MTGTGTLMTFEIAPCGSITYDIDLNSHAAYYYHRKRRLTYRTICVAPNMYLLLVSCIFLPLLLKRRCGTRRKRIQKPCVRPSRRQRNKPRGRLSTLPPRRWRGLTKSTKVRRRLTHTTGRLFAGDPRLRISISTGHQIPLRLTRKAG